MYKKIILTLCIVLSLLTYKFEILIPLGFVLVVFYLFQVHNVLLANKRVMDENNGDFNKSITSLHNNQKVIASDIKSLKVLTNKNAKKIKSEM